MPRKIKTPQEKGNKKSVKYAVFMAVNFTWMFALYRIMIMLGERLETILPYAICSGAYLAAATVLLGICYFCTSGETDVEKKEKYKPLFLWAFPIILVLLLDVLETVIFDNIINLFK
ncbi:MAG: hypothetical protein IKL36_07125 [Clostridia bacterium]|nr:hypothetical protein [Clostridia bacterium]